jgi:hypothetical protein
VEDANEKGFSREDLDQAAGGDLKAYIREAIAPAFSRRSKNLCHFSPFIHSSLSRSCSHHQSLAQTEPSFFARCL